MKRSQFIYLMVAVLLIALCMSIVPAEVMAAPSPPVQPNQPVASPGTVSDAISNVIGSDNPVTVDIVLLLTILSVLPSILLMLTSFTRVIIVLSFIRNAMGVQQMPPNQVMVGLALFLTFFVMGPVIDQVKVEAYDPYVKNEITQEVAVERAIVPIREFMLRQAFKSDVKFFYDMNLSMREQGKAAVDDTDAAAEADTDTASVAMAEDYSNVPFQVIIPAFMVSEIKQAFQMGFFIYIPFIVIDMVVASTLLAMGMMMLPPTIISLPFKVLVFIAVNGWNMTIETLVKGFWRT